MIEVVDDRTAVEEQAAEAEQRKAGVEKSGLGLACLVFRL